MIRKANEKDAERITRIHLNSWRTTYNNVFPVEVFDKQESEYISRVENIKNAIINNTSNYIVLEENNIVKAFICYGDARGDKYKDYKEIYSIYIEKNNQRKGYGSKLIKYCFDLFKKENFGGVIIRCLKGNTAEEFYHKMGGEVIDSESCTLHGTNITENIYEFILNQELCSINRVLFLSSKSIKYPKLTTFYK